MPTPLKTLAAPKLLALMLMLGLLLAASHRCPAQVYDTPAAAKSDSDFELQGEYVDSKRGLQVIAQGDGVFSLKIYQNGLPGAGWDRSAVQTVEADEDTLAELIGNFERVNRKSPTLGAKPPKGAVVLFDGTQESLQQHWRKGARITADGLLMEGCTSTDTFGDYSIHLEFRLPFMPKARGQGRANSGLYHQGRYETQILDSFGLAGKNNEAGGIYEIRDPDVNMCLPPLVWQTYDVDFTAARYEESGKKTSNAKITVRLNGVVVHREVELPRGTRAAPVKEGPEDGPIYLQNHGNPVRFRNIWVKPRDVEGEARRPIVPGFERAHGGAGTVAGGRLLLGELNCLSCHQAGESLARFLKPKQAPILDGIGKRVHTDWLLDYLADPRATKPGTTMPDVLGGMSESQRREAAVALTHFLVGNDTVVQGGKRASSGAGERLFHEAGCVACHLPRNEGKVNPNTSVPLVGLEEKYSRASLQAFLKDPLAVRPSGRMPRIDLGDQGWADVAQYLTGDTSAVFGNRRERPEKPNMRYAVYHGTWDKLPDFDKLKPARTGVSRGLDWGVSDRSDLFGIRFDGFLPITQSGKYSFRLSSDDGSALYIDGKKVIDNDGVHGVESRETTLALAKGTHQIRVDFFEKNGGEEVNLAWAGPGVKSGLIDKAIVMNREDTDLPSEPKVEAEEGETYVYDPAKAAKGRQLFASLGCASCHQRSEGGRRIESTSKAPRLADCDPGKGCLADEISGKTPNFELLDTQVAALAAAVEAQPPRVEPAADVQLEQTMASLNCYACHQRDGIGGPESDRNKLFISTIPEMGDEGRLPPPLDGIGDKLRKDWLQKVITGGAKDRPYMRTFMPGFGESNAGHLVATFHGLDARSDAKIAAVDGPQHRLVSSGRRMVGSKGLACVSCHTFGKYKATGIQAIALDTMSQRIREDWFHRYLMDPQRYRPGTRMPTGFPEGKSTVTDIYDGDPGKQVSAIWAFLEKGTSGGVPEGIVSGMIELKADHKPVIYRNFIEGVSPRGIAVGYPEKVNLCWDANQLSLALIWQDRFIDAAKHWIGRGPGNQSPLGGSILRIEAVSPVAILADANTPWPTEPPKQRGYRFVGYQLDDAGRPTFRYQSSSFRVRDTPLPVAGKLVGTFRRELAIEPIANADVSGQIFVRAASAASVEVLKPGTFKIDGLLTLTIESDAEPIVRQSNGNTEVLVPITGASTVTQEIVW